jgi:Skp family chaperone for outer membrane proteins
MEYRTVPGRKVLTKTGMSGTFPATSVTSPFNKSHLHIYQLQGSELILAKECSVKKYILSMLALAVMITASTAYAQVPATSTTGHKIGLIDMAFVFEKYEKFASLRDDLKAEMDQTDAEAKQMVERLQKMQQEIAKFDAGGAQYEQAEKQILNEKGKLDGFVGAAKRRFGRREADMLKVVYTDVTDAVKLYADYAKYDHVIRFNRKGMDDTTNPQEAIQTMNKTFIYWKPENDITDQVLGYLNKQYAQTAQRGTKVTPVSGSGPAPIR